jgi:hypothetical protein
LENPRDAAKRILTLIPADPTGWGANRCDGTLEELAKYRTGSFELGWDVRAEPLVGDLLVGTVGQGKDRVIVNVNRVEGVMRQAVEWSEETDVPIVPSVAWSEVAGRFGGVRIWQRITGPDAVKFIHAIADELRTMSDVSEREGASRAARCRQRSTKNRIRKLDAAQGVCEGCTRNFRFGFGVRGDRALEVHHRKPLHETTGEIQTRLADLAVLCASCHRLVHADPELRIAALQAGWSRIRSQT